MYNGDKTVSSVNVVGKKRHTYVKESNWTIFSYHISKLNSKWFNGLNVKT